MTQAAVEQTKAPQLSPEHEAIVGALVQIFEQLIPKAPAQIEAPKPLPVWITIEQASEYSGLSENLLRRMVKAKVLLGIQDGSTKVRKSDVDAFDPAKLVDLPKAKPGGYAYAKGKK
jgi:excisionase family DNA binding protein